MQPRIVCSHVAAYVTLVKFYRTNGLDMLKYRIIFLRLPGLDLRLPVVDEASRVLVLLCSCADQEMQKLWKIVQSDRTKPHMYWSKLSKYTVIYIRVQVGPILVAASFLFTILSHSSSLCCSFLGLKMQRLTYRCSAIPTRCGSSYLTPSLTKTASPIPVWPVTSAMTHCAAIGEINT